MNRRSISASFSLDEIEAIDSVCKKFGIKTRGKLIRTAIKFFMHEKPYEKFAKKYPNATQALAELAIIEMDKKGKNTQKKIESRLSKHSKSFLAHAAYEMERGLPELTEQYDAYRTLAKKKPKGRPRIKKKRGRPKS
jgi:metal-responsive CopG/Arc/MetJ family transcriptional regulator